MKGTKISTINLETLGIYFLGSYMDEVLQNMMAGRTNGAVQYNTWVKLVELKLIELSTKVRFGYGETL